MHDRSAWARGSTGEQRIKNKTYKSLTEFSRACQSCGERFSIFVTSKIANGHADSNSFGLKNCEQHRRNRTPAQGDAVAQLELVNRNLRDECEGHIARIEELKAELALYKPPSAQEALRPENIFPWSQNSG